MIKILKSKKGVSLLIVLTIMMFLITLASVTLTSSLGVASTTQTQWNKVQIDLLAQSVQTSLQDMLNSNTEIAGSTNLQTAIISSAYNYANPADPLARPPLFDKLTISVDEELKDADGNPAGTITHSVECDLEINLQFSGTDVTGFIVVDANINLNDENQDNLAEKATYRMSFKLDTAAEYDEAANSVTTYGKWALVDYEKLTN